jgi:hypothetical protein
MSHLSNGTIGWFLSSLKVSVPLLLLSIPELTSAQGVGVKGTESRLPPSLRIIALQGENASNVITRRIAIQPVVEVRDETEKPVAGAEVVFALPQVGPGGFFERRALEYRTKTDARGQATAQFTPNDYEGRFNIHVTTTFGARSGSSVIPQRNIREGVPASGRVKSGNSAVWKVLAVIAAGGATGGVLALTRKGSSGAPPPAVVPPITLSAGTITVGPPR